MTHFQNEFARNRNCLMVQEFECGKCDFHFITDKRGGIGVCPICGTAIEAVGTIIINRGECTHKAMEHGHEYHV